MRTVLNQAGQLGKTNWDAVIRVCDQVGNVIELALILALRASPIQVAQKRLAVIGSHNEPFSVIAVRIGNEDRSPVEVHSCDAAPTPTGIADIVSDDFPVLHAQRIPARLLY
jgi:hypothetical protein